MMFVLVELKKIREHYTELCDEVLRDDALTWAYLLVEGYRHQREVETIMAEFPDIATFAEEYGKAINDPEVIAAYESALSAEREYNARQLHFERVRREAIEEGLNEGRELGLEQGKTMERERIVSLLREMGADETLIDAIDQADLVSSLG